MSDLGYESLSGTVLPIFISDGDEFTGFCGSGVLLAKGIFVTCWHCVRVGEAGPRLVVAMPGRNGSCEVLDLEEVEQDAAGADLAIGCVDAEPVLSLELARGSHVLMGHDVWSFGYPYTDQQPAAAGGYDFTLNGRILRGYVTRTFVFQHPDGAQVDSYELDMPVPSGMSGAPLVLRGGLEVSGIVFGTHDVETVDVETHPGQRVQTTRVVSFGLAHTAGTLRQASAGATGGVRLADFLAE